MRSRSWGGRSAFAMAMLMALLVAGGVPASAQQCAECTAAGAAITGALGTGLSAQTVAIINGLQGTAGQISANIRGVPTALGAVVEGLDAHQTERLAQSDRVEAARSFQFSNVLCQSATGQAISTAAAQTAMTAGVKASQVNQLRTSGLDETGGGTPTVLEPNRLLQERAPLFCDAADPVCRGTAGTRPGADRMPGAILAIGGFREPLDAQQAAWVVNNLTQVVPVVPLTQRQSDSPDGRAQYLKRGADETKMVLARDVVSEILVDRRLPTIDPTWYNAVATQYNLPTITGNASVEDMDRLTFRDIAGAGLHQDLTTLDQAALTRELINVEQLAMQQRYYMTHLAEVQALLSAATLAVLVEPRIQAAGGRLN